MTRCCNSDILSPTTICMLRFVVVVFGSILFAYPAERFIILVIRFEVLIITILYAILISFYLSDYPKS